MDSIHVLFIHSMMFHGRIWRQVASQLNGSGIKLELVEQSQALDALDSKPDILIADLSVGGADYQAIITGAKKIAYRLGLSAEIPTDFISFDQNTKREFTEYCEKLSMENYCGAIELLAARAGFAVTMREKREVLTCGIYHPDEVPLFYSSASYLGWRRNHGRSVVRQVAIIFYYGQMVESSVEEIDTLIVKLEEKGFCPIPIFSEGVEGSLDRPDWYRLVSEIPDLGAVVSCMAGRLLKNQNDTELLKTLNVPVIQTLRSHSQSPGQWLEDPQGLPTMSAVFSQTYPEIFGAIRPTMFAGLKELPGQHQNSWMRHYLPIVERIETLCGRLDSHFNLREKRNQEKRLTIVLHNNPCKGVEATVGMAVGLDTFDSLGRLLKRLREAGYDVGDCPADGQRILEEILAKKAIAEFRWTTVDEIVTKGGTLHMMDEEEYTRWFYSQDESVRLKILEDWGVFPGESMAWKQDGKDVLVITGLQYGNITIINQPKRGCYGAKCTGEVCRILHDPNLSPPHHWFATYKYIRDNSDAVIHFGTEGSLEYLPGKQNGLSGNCFPEVSLGSLPNFYVYVMDAIGEGMVAKRRGQATLIDHLGPVFSPVKLDPAMIKTEQLLDQYSQAKSSMDRKRQSVLEEQLLPEMKQLGLLEGPQGDDLSPQLDVARRRLAAIKNSLAPEGLHVLGQTPSLESRGRLLATMLRKPDGDMSTVEELGLLLEGEEDNYTKVAQFLAGVSPTSPCDTGDTIDTILTQDLKTFCLQAEEKLEQCGQEISAILDGLDGGYIHPGPAGSLAAGRLDPLPTGRNFYAKDVALLPTRAALKVGVEAADNLLIKYLEEEGRFPERIGLSIWSSDAFKNDGELFCQILSLMGVRPVWDKQEKVKTLEIIPLELLTLEFRGEQRPRPRVDVTIETSAIMRDMVPTFCELLDRAVVLVSDIDEPYERNFIKKHTDKQLEELRNSTEDRLEESEMRRMATFRLFSSAPGTYGVGVGLALDASAWTTDQELAEIYINWSGHGLGEGGASQAARDILARQLAGLDIAYMKQASEEYDILDCGCYAVSQGSMATATRALSGRQVKSYWMEAGGGKELLDVREQLQRSAASRLLNPNWINSMKEHGYQGAMAVGSRVNNLFKWSATSHEVSKDLFDRVVSTYILDSENSKWLMESNKYAMEEITRRLLEAASRDLWDADEDLLEAVRQTALDIEGDMEELMGEVSEEFQGGKVEVLGIGDVEKWQHEWGMTK